MNLQKIFLLLVFFTLLTSCKAKTIKTSESFNNPTLNSNEGITLDEKITKWQKELNIPNVGVGVIKDGKIVSTKVYGRLKNGKPAPVNTLFSVASISKVVFSTLVLKLVQEGRWNLDEPLYKYYLDPDVKDDPLHKKLTTRHVLSHQSGFNNWRRSHPTRKLTFDFEPGNGYGYSGEGIFYLQKAIEKKFNKSLEELVKEKLFDPIDMKDSRYAWDGKKDVERFSRWFDTDGNEYVTDFSTEANAANSLMTTVGDLSKFGVELLKGAGLSKHLFNEMIKTQRRINPNLEQGIGWRVINNLANGEYAIQHGGNQSGASAIIVLLPKSKRGVVVAANSFNGFMLVNEIVRDVLPEGKEIMHRAYRRTKLSDVPEVFDIEGKLLDSYEGIYFHPDGRELHVSRRGKMLQTRMERTRDYRYFAESNAKFFQIDLDIKLEFVRGEKGGIDEFVIIDGDNKTRFTRKKAR